MEDAFQILPCLGIGENAAGQNTTPELTLGVDDFRTEAALDLGQRGLARLDDLARQVIRVNHPDPASPQQTRAGRLAHADAAREPEGSHARQGVCSTAR
jgi:hypothetical protein